MSASAPVSCFLFNLLFVSKSFRHICSQTDTKRVYLLIVSCIMYSSAK